MQAAWISLQPHLTGSIFVNMLIPHVAGCVRPAAIAGETPQLLSLGSPVKHLHCLSRDSGMAQWSATLRKHQGGTVCYCHPFTQDTCNETARSKQVFNATVINNSDKEQAALFKLSVAASGTPVTWQGAFHVWLHLTSTPTAPSLPSATPILKPLILLLGSRIIQVCPNDPTEEVTTRECQFGLVVPKPKPQPKCLCWRHLTVHLFKTL